MAFVAATENTVLLPAQIVLFPGCVVITGICPSNTVTVKVHLEELPHPSVAVEVTVVTPSGKLLPDAGTFVILTAPAQLSVAVKL